MQDEIHIVFFDTTLDNIPYRAFASLSDAIDCANAAPEEVPEPLLKIMGCDAAQVVCISVFSFKKGIPLDRNVIRDLS